MKDKIAFTRRVMVVDDEPDILILYERIFKKYGFEFYGARSGEEAIERVQACRPYLILMDIMMPGMDGFETCRYIKTKMEPENVPFIYLFSNKVSTDEINKAIKYSNADGFLPKTMEFKELIEFIENLFQAGQKNEPFKTVSDCL